MASLKRLQTIPSLTRASSVSLMHTLSAGSRCHATAPAVETSSPTDGLRGALTSRLCDPAAPLPSNQVYERLVNPCRLVDEFNFAKTTKRQARQHAALRFLRRHNVLMHSLLFYAPRTATWNTTAEFERLALLGESVLRAEVRGRVLKLFPEMPHATYADATKRLLGRESLVGLFDALGMAQLVGSRPPPRPAAKSPRGRPGQARVEVPRWSVPTADERYGMLCATVGEMHWFAARTKATDRTHNNALFPPSDVLILHVLCTHLLECLPAELIFGELEPLIQKIRAVWVNEPMSVPSQLRTAPHTIGALSLAAAPHAPSAPELTRRDPGAGVASAAALRPLTASADENYVKSFMRPKCSHKHFDSPWYSILPDDKRGTPPPLAAARDPTPNSPADASLWSDARRRELTLPASTL